ncbi:phosphate butyryltransferase [bacterium]|nr:phosphate butyryltransferase [bacterium]
MEPIRHLEALEKAVKGGPQMTMAVASGEDPATIHAISRAALEGFVQVILVGSTDKIRTLLEHQASQLTDKIEICHADNEAESAKLAVQLVHDGRAHFLMKGLVGTSVFMKAILDKQMGLVPPDGLLSHISVMEVPSYPKLILFSDAAILLNPTMDEKVKILKYGIQLAYSLGIEMPKVALVSAVEKISFKLQSSIDAAVIKAMAERKQIEGAIVDGPLALDVALSSEHCRIKGLDSPINGEADILIFPNIETANTFYKSLTLLAKGKSASVMVGGKVPAVITSRADEDDSKFYSIVLAARMAAHIGEK